jgi:hypothetical protein
MQNLFSVHYVDNQVLTVIQSLVMFGLCYDTISIPGKRILFICICFIVYLTALSITQVIVYSVDDGRAHE